MKLQLIPASLYRLCVQFNNYSKGSPQSPQLQQEFLTILLAKKDSATYPIAKENHSSIEY